MTLNIDKFQELTDRLRGSRKLVLAVVFLALLLDNVLLTVVVPIIPEFLMNLEGEDELFDRDKTGPDGYVYLWNESYVNWTHFDHWFPNTSYNNVTKWNTYLHDIAMNENTKVGWLFSSKAIVQLIANPFIGPITNKIGYTIPMLVGFLINVLSTLLYAFGETYTSLFIARSVHGLSSSCVAIAGLSMLASAYPDDKERSKAMGIALGGLALGVLIGYPFGSLTYEFIGKMAPFLIFLVFTLADGALMIWVLQPSITSRSEVAGTPLKTLLKDPYILLASGAILFPEMAMALLEATLPIWMIETMQPPNWQLGTAFLPDSIGYLIGTNAFGIIAYKMGRWLCTAIALIIMGVCLLCIPFATQISHLIVPHFGLGLSLGMADVAIMPMLALLVDNRHVAVYGTVYAIAQVSISLGFAIGPSLGGVLVKLLGFDWLMRGMAILNLLYAPLCCFLREVPMREENKSILMEDGCTASKYVEEPQFKYERLEED